METLENTIAIDSYITSNPVDATTLVDLLEDNALKVNPIAKTKNDLVSIGEERITNSENFALYNHANYHAEAAIVQALSAVNNSQKAAVKAKDADAIISALTEVNNLSNQLHALRERQAGDNRYRKLREKALLNAEGTLLVSKNIDLETFLCDMTEIISRGESIETRQVAFSCLLTIAGNVGLIPTAKQAIELPAYIERYTEKVRTLRSDAIQAKADKKKSAKNEEK